MKELSLRKIRFIIKHSRSGDLSAHQIIKLMKINKTTHYRILRRYKDVKNIYKITLDNREEKKPGRKSKPIPYKSVEKVLECRLKYRTNANNIQELLKVKEDISLSHHTIYKILKSADMIREHKKKKKRDKWVRFERKHSLSLWQTDWTQISGKWLIVFIDDASRLVVGWKLFENATSQNSIEVLKEAIKKHGKPAAILTGRDVQFYASKRDNHDQGKTEFQKFLDKNEIDHIYGRLRS